MKRILVSLFAAALFATSAFAQQSALPMVPSGGSSSSGGAVSSVSNSDGTLTISPTSGAVLASLSLGHANTWSGQQTFVAPVLGAATGTSLALGGATLGSNTFAVTGLGNFASVGSASAPTLSVGNQTTGLYSVSTTGLGFSVNGVSEFDYGVTTGGAFTFGANG